MSSPDAEQPTLDAALLSRCLTMLEGDVAALCASACVSKAWNQATQDPRVWRWLVVPRRLAGEMTDERFKELLRRSGGAVERLDISHCGELSRTAISDAIKDARASLTHLAVAYTRISTLKVVAALDGKRLTYLSVRGLDICDASDADFVEDEPYNEVKTRVLALLNACVTDTAAAAVKHASSTVRQTQLSEPCFYTVRKDAWKWNFFEEPRPPRPPKVVLHYAKDPRDYENEEQNPPLPKDDLPPQAGLDVSSACTAWLLDNLELAYGYDPWGNEGERLADAVGVCGRMCGGAAARAYGEMHCPQCQRWNCSVCAPNLLECNVHGLLVCNICVRVRDGYWCSEECFDER